MNRQRISTLRWLGLAFAVLIVAACGTAPAAPTETAMPSQAPEPSDTLVPPPTLIPTATLEPGQVSAKVIKIIDAATIRVEIDGEQQNVCYERISHYRRFHPYDDLAREAEAVNQEMMKGQTVILEKRDQGETESKYCLNRFVFLEDGTFVNVELLRLGLVKYTDRSSGKYVDIFDAAEQEAQASGLGTWGIATSTPFVVPTMEYERFFLGDVRITDLSSMTAADEYIQIECDPLFPKPGGIYDISGWQIVAEGTGKVFVFPEFVELFGGSTCRVYTGEPASECGGRKLSFKSSSEIWRNEHDCAYLFNPDGELEAKYCY
jgi:endonuclease YncB( thermonuclease family)